MNSPLSGHHTELCVNSTWHAAMLLQLLEVTSSVKDACRMFTYRRRCHSLYDYVSSTGKTQEMQRRRQGFRITGIIVIEGTHIFNHLQLIAASRQSPCKFFQPINQCFPMRACSEASVEVFAKHLQQRSKPFLIRIFIQQKSAPSVQSELETYSLP